MEESGNFSVTAKCEEASDRVVVLSKEKAKLESLLKESDENKSDLTAKLHELMEQIEKKDAEIMQTISQSMTEFKVRDNSINSLKAELKNFEILVPELESDVEKCKHFFKILQDILFNNGKNIPNDDFLFKNEVEAVLGLKNEIESFQERNRSAYQQCKMR